MRTSLYLPRSTLTQNQKFPGKKSIWSQNWKSTLYKQDKLISKSGLEKNWIFFLAKLGKSHKDIFYCSVFSSTGKQLIETIQYPEQLLENSINDLQSENAGNRNITC